MVLANPRHVHPFGDGQMSCMFLGGFLKCVEMVTSVHHFSETASTCIGMARTIYTLRIYVGLFLLMYGSGQP